MSHKRVPVQGPIGPAPTERALASQSTLTSEGLVRWRSSKRRPLALSQTPANQRVVELFSPTLTPSRRRRVLDLRNPNAGTWLTQMTEI